ncbi:MAG: hypothetical protein KBT32_05690 [Bacteroidales bacterium]|nr:hypothetical protein [Candidatus Physcocola equi]
MGLFDSLVDAAAKKAAEIQQSASEVVDSVSSIAGQAADAVCDGASQVGESISNTASEAYDSIVTKKNETLNDIQEYSAIKFYEFLNSFDFTSYIKTMKETQEKEKKDLTLLIDFMEKIQAFALEGKKEYLDKKN